MVVRILFFLTIMVCVGDWQIQIIFTQRNQYSCPEFSYANNDVFMHAPCTFNRARSLERPAPIGTNILMGIFEEKFIRPLVNNMARQYLQFIHNIFFDTDRNIDQLLIFKQWINETRPSIKFDFKFLKEINFLDTVCI